MNEILKPSYLRLPCATVNARRAILGIGPKA